MTEQSQPALILGEESQRIHGSDAQSMNITVGRAVSKAVRSTLGPTGMDKMLVGDGGIVTVTNDGATILEKLDIEHPVARMIVEVAEAQEAEIGDGTTTAVILAGELLDNAEDLLDEGIHPTTIASGYLEAAIRSRDYLEEIATPVASDDTEILRKIAKTSMTGKGSGIPLDHLADLVIEAIEYIADNDRVDVDDIKVDSIQGGTVQDSHFIDGIPIHKEPLRDDMPTHIEDAEIALIDADIDVRESDADPTVNLTDSEQLQRFREREEAELREAVDTLLETGVDVVFCQQTVDDLAQQWFAERGILAFRRIRDSDMRLLARATGAKIVSRVDECTEDDLGSAGRVEYRDFGDDFPDYRIFVEACPDSKSASILLRGSSEHVVDELERTVTDALKLCQITIEDETVLTGGGAAEIEIVNELFEYADGISGREQLAIKAFAEAVGAIPRTLATNAGDDPLDTIVELRNRHNKGEINAGYSAQKGVIDLQEEGVIEPLRVKTQSIASAQAAVELILRIDDVIAAGDLAVKEEDTGNDRAL